MPAAVRRDFCGRGCEVTHELLCNLFGFALGDESRDVSCVVLNLSRQRPGESHSTVLVLDDDGGRAQTDFAALALADVIEDGGEIGITCRFVSDRRCDAERFEKRLKIGPGGSLVVNDGLRAEQGLFEVVVVAICGNGSPSRTKTPTPIRPSVTALRAAYFPDFTSCSSTPGGAIRTSTFALSPICFTIAGAVAKETWTLLPLSR